MLMGQSTHRLGSFCAEDNIWTTSDPDAEFVNLPRKADGLAVAVRKAQIMILHAAPCIDSPVAVDSEAHLAGNAADVNNGRSRT